MKFQVLEFNIGELQQGRYPFHLVETAGHIEFNLRHAALGRASAWNMILLMPDDAPEPLRSYAIAQRKITALELALRTGILTKAGRSRAQELLKQNWAEVEEYDSIHG